MNELLIYGFIYDFSAAEFVSAFAEVEGESVTCRINTNGGGPEAGWSMIGRLIEFKGSKLVKVDGKAYSMGAFILCYADDSECYDVSQFLFHRASYGMWYENEYMDEGQRTNLINVNKKLREAFEAKIDVAKFENLKVCKEAGITVNRLFSMEERVDVYLTADDAKKIGLVNRIVKITPSKAASINKSVAKMAANSESIDALMIKIPIVEATKETPNAPEVKPKNTSKMTPEEFKALHPEAYASIVGTGIAQERDRVGAWAVFAEIDPKAVAEGIKSGNPLSMTATAEFQMKLMTSGKLTALAGEAKPGAEATTDTPPVATSAVDALQAKVNELAGIKPVEAK